MGLTNSHFASNNKRRQRQSPDCRRQHPPNPDDQSNDPALRPRRRSSPPSQPRPPTGRSRHSRDRPCPPSTRDDTRTITLVQMSEATSTQRRTASNDPGRIRTPRRGSPPARCSSTCCKLLRCCRSADRRSTNSSGSGTSPRYASAEACAFRSTISSSSSPTGSPRAGSEPPKCLSFRNLDPAYSVLVSHASDDQRNDESATLTEQLWATEIEHRAKRVLEGHTTGEPWDRVRERISRSSLVNDPLTRSQRGPIGCALGRIGPGHDRGTRTSK